MGCSIFYSFFLMPSSLGRHMLVVFPVFTAWAQLQSAEAFRGRICPLTMLLALVTTLFPHWYWVGYR